MTVKEFNRIRHAAYLEAIKIESVKNAFSTNNTVYIYDIAEGQKHQIEALSWESQMNDELLRQNGFTTAARVRLIMTLNRATQAADF